jgi:hypothetical protein
LEIGNSARKHGIADGEMLHAFNHHIRYVEQDYDGEPWVLLIGPDSTGRLLELVVVDGPRSSTLTCCG